MTEPTVTNEFNPDTDFPLYDENGSNAVDASIDPLAGGTLNNKPIWTAEQVAAYLNRTGGGYADGFNDTPVVGRQNNIGDDNSVITFGFFETQDQLFTNGYVYESGGALYGLAEFFNFATFSEAQRAATREAMSAWDDVVAVSFREASADDADLNFANLASAPTTQAYSRIPTLGLDTTLGGQVREIGGDVWISASQASNFRLDEGQYGIHTLVHEVGHSLGLSHPGAYNAGSGGAITYAANAEYAQDTRAYSVMSYFEGNSISGTRHFDFNISTTVYAATPLIHDILAAQRIYGADMTTRTGDTVYGFNSNAGRDSFDFTLTPAPIMAIWDAGGVDTIDASGYTTNQVLNLTAGSLSSIGGVTYDTAPTYEQVLANRAAAGITTALPRATYDANMAALFANPIVGRLTDNVGIAYGATIENAIGGSGNDSLIGNGVDNVLRGNAGSDMIGAGAGNDTLDGGTGNDTMLGGVGNDFYFVDATGDIVSDLAGEGIDTVSSSIDYSLGADIENLILTGSATAGNGNDLDNNITGNALGNRLNGGAGNDRMSGGDGVDFFTGGADRDIFVAEINATPTASRQGPISLDVITDFQGGIDTIDFSGIDAVLGLAGDQAFTFRGTSANRNAGDLSYKVYDSVNGAENAHGVDIDGIDGPSSYVGPVTILFGNVDGGAPDFMIALLNTNGVTPTDFLF